MAVNRNIVVLVALVAVTISAFASYSLYTYLKGQEIQTQKAAKAAGATRSVIVASREIQVGSTISAEDVKVTNWPTESISAGVYATKEEVVGMVPIETIMSGEPVYSSKLIPKGGASGVMVYKIPAGHRAMTVGVDQVSGVAGFITPSSMVDVMLVTTLPDRRDQISKIVLQNVPVLATGQIIDQKDGKPVIVPTVTLDVTPEDAEKLALSSKDGQLQLLLRRSGDIEVATTKGSNIYAVVGMGVATPTRIYRMPEKKAEAPVYKPKGHTVEVWRENKRTIETFNMSSEGGK